MSPALDLLPDLPRGRFRHKDFSFSRCHWGVSSARTATDAATQGPHPPGHPIPVSLPPRHRGLRRGAAWGEPQGPGTQVGPTRKPSRELGFSAGQDGGCEPGPGTGGQEDRRTGDIPIQQSSCRLWTPPAATPRAQVLGSARCLSVQHRERRRGDWILGHGRLRCAGCGRLSGKMSVLGHCPFAPPPWNPGTPSLPFLDRLSELCLPSSLTAPTFSVVLGIEPRTFPPSYISSPFSSCFYVETGPQ